MFGKKKPKVHNILLLDIESASIGAALAHLEQGSAPVLFAEQRVELALPRTLNSASIAKQIEAATHKVLSEIGVVAARLRSSEKTASKGVLTNAAVFLGAPWGVPNLAAGKPTFHQPMQTFLAGEIQALAHQLPLSFYTSADSAAYGSILLRGDKTMLVAIVRGEVTELVLLGERGALGYATVPVGSRSIYRTLQTHAGLSLAEIPAILSLAHHPSSPHHEPLEAAGQHILEQFAGGVEAIAEGGTPESLIILADEPLGSWFARSLEGEGSLGALFAPGATVQAFGGKHAAAYLTAHVPNPDLHLALGALFTHRKLFTSV